MMKITISRSGLAAIGRSGYREVGRFAVGAAGHHWWKTFLPLHFQNIAYLRYRYARRSAKYGKAKQARAKGADGVPACGENLPLVFTGRSRERALSAPNVKAKATDYQTYRADVVINAPAFNFGAGERIDMRDEVTRRTEIELANLQKVFARNFWAKLKTMGVKKTYKIA